VIGEQRLNLLRGTVFVEDVVLAQAVKKFPAFQDPLPYSREPIAVTGTHRSLVNSIQYLIFCIFWINFKINIPSVVFYLSITNIHRTGIEILVLHIAVDKQDELEFTSFLNFKRRRMLRQYKGGLLPLPQKL
jgi:hypothetical protein